jgi:uncharacterized protein (DUF1330 family)
VLIVTQQSPGKFDQVHAEKALLIVFARITDRTKFASYVQALPAVYAQFSGHYLAMAAQPSVQRKGDSAQPWSIVLSAWRDLELVREFWFSKAYQDVATKRAGTGEFHVNSSALELAPQLGMSILISTNNHLHLDRMIPEPFGADWLEGGGVIPSMQIYCDKKDLVAQVWSELADQGMHYCLDGVT